MSPFFNKQTHQPPCGCRLQSQHCLYTSPPIPRLSNSVVWWNVLLRIPSFLMLFPLKIKTQFSVALRPCPFPLSVSCAYLCSNELFLLQISWFQLYKF